MKYLSKDQIKELIGSQSVARQCLVPAIIHQLEGESSTSTEGGLQQSRISVLSMDVVLEGAIYLVLAIIYKNIL